MRVAKLTPPIEKNFDPKTVATVLDGAADPLATIEIIAKQAGLDKNVTRELILRLKAQYAPVAGALRRVKTSELQELLDDRAYKLLTYLDDNAMQIAASKGDIKALAVAIGVVLEKRQLLRGEPTQILNVEERMAMDKLIPAILREAARRGLSVEDRGPIIDITPEPERQARPRTASNIDKIMKVKEQEMQEFFGEPTVESEPEPDATS